jgi:hypothetical protein
MSLVKFSAGPTAVGGSLFREWIPTLVDASRNAVKDSRGLRLLSRGAVEESRRARSWTTNPPSGVRPTAVIVDRQLYLGTDLA